MPAKKDMTPVGTLALNCYRNLLIDHSQPRLTYLFPKLKSHLATFEKVRVVEECSGDRGASIFREGTAMHEHRWTKCIYVMGDYIKKQ